ncbi:MAG: AsnC family transcriptional regulator, partial [Rhodoferax sp.]|nr:AsnC family transcriptional regulator [Rhodoferax sp.]
MAVSSTKKPAATTKVRARSVVAAPLPSAAAEALDRTDRAILRALQRDASVSNVALAAKVNLSPPACLRRVERLKASGLVKGIV